MKCPRCKADNPEDAIYCGACQAKLKDIAWKLTEDGPPLGAFSAPGPKATLLEVGAVFADRYEILAVIGEGGMGVVYRAHDRVVKKEVALKLVRAERLAGADAVERLIREGAIARDIRHPNIVAVYDVGEVQGQPYLSMEYLAGKSLHAWNRERAMSGAECSMKAASRIIEEILQGLDAAHRAGVVHRDLKPENIMLLSEPDDQGVKLKILDFGVARAAGGGATGATATGTIGYMAPEQKRAPDAARPPADLYSLSVIFYELLVDADPEGVWEPPSKGRRDVPPGVDALILKGLSKRATMRQQSVAEYARELAQAQAAAGGVAAGSFQKWLGGLENTEFRSAWEKFKEFGMSGGLVGQLSRGGSGEGGPSQPQVRHQVHSLQSAVPPAGNKSLWQWFMYGLGKRYADGRGRAHRKEFWGFMLGATVVLVVGLAIDLSTFGEYAVSEGSAPVTTLTLLALLAPSIAVTSRRLHDQGYSGWLALATVVPIVGLIIGLPRGTPGSNAYGDDPLIAGAAA
jgi:uncharacterized membrane protein YhaH (DUF805 family)/tRNA A-37 threonylcarbamoyl transferase component Bud32